MSHPPEFIDAVRRCADADMSTMQAAKELSTSERSLTRNAIIGIAHRNGIKFTPRPSSVRRPKPATALVTHVVSPKSDGWKTKPPPLRCSWAGCGCDAGPGDMFCHSHARMPIMAAR